MQVMTTGLEICLRLSAVPCRSSTQAQSCVRNNCDVRGVPRDMSVKANVPGEGVCASTP